MTENIPEHNKDLKEAWKVADLMTKFIRHEISADEQQQLDTWKNESASNQAMFDELTNEKNIQKARDWMRDIEVQREKVLLQVKQKIDFIPSQSSPLVRLWKVAVAVIVLITGAALLYQLKKTDNDKKESFIVKSQDIPPGGAKATLKLSDGTIIDLNNAKADFLGKPEASLVSKTGKGQISYSDTATVTPLLYNILTTPMGGQYSVELPDGSKAWLNAASSLQYELSFKTRRTVEATGEVYFEVKKGTIPFIVKARNTSVEVLGTHFNVDAYKEVKTTLLEGSVKMIHENEMRLLKPGDMGIAGEKMTVKHLEYPEDMVEWKNGLFHFSKATIPEIMEQLARWYKIDVRYEGNSGSGLFSVTARRDENISTILNNIQKTDRVHFRIEGRNVTVLP